MCSCNRKAGRECGYHQEVRAALMEMRDAYLASLILSDGGE